MLRVRPSSTFERTVWMRLLPTPHPNRFLDTRLSLLSFFLLRMVSLFGAEPCAEESPQQSLAPGLHAERSAPSAVEMDGDSSWIEIRKGLCMGS